MYKKIQNNFTGTITGKQLNIGGSLIRTEATGYGVVYFTENMLTLQNNSISEKIVVISGSGNVAQYACEKAMELGAKVVTLSDSCGYIYDEDGIDNEKLKYVIKLKNIKRGRIEEYAKRVQDGSTDIFAEKLPDSCYPTKQELEFWVEYVID